MSHSTVQMLPKLWQLRAMLTALDHLLCAHHPLGQSLSLIPQPSPDTVLKVRLHSGAIPSFSQLAVL